jgi:hypothetical protein
LSWMRTSWHIPSQTTFASKTVELVHTLVRKTFPTSAVHTFIAKAKWKSGFITKKDVLPGVKPPTTACLTVLWHYIRIGPTTGRLARSPDSSSLLW